MDAIFPGVGSPAFESAVANLEGTFTRIEGMFDELQIGAESGQAVAVVGSGVLERLGPEWNALLDAFRTLQGYIGCLVAANSRDDAAIAKQSEFDGFTIRLSKLSTRFTEWLGNQDVEAIIARGGFAQAHAFSLRLTKVAASYLMSEAEEALAADLSPSGGSAWSKLYGKVTSQIETDVEIEGKTSRLSMSQVRALSSDPNEATRRAAYHAELDAWKKNEAVLAACMNGIKGEVLTLNKKRGWGSPLDESIFNAHIDKPTLDAMMSAANDAFPAFRRYLKAKAKAIQGDGTGLAWHNLFAPVGSESKSWSIAEGSSFVESNFRQFSDRMADFAARTFEEYWIDYPPRPGKVGGAFCMGIRSDESRILMNYKPSFDSVSTLAHELGHAYHNLCMKDRTPIQRMYPMTLAETASIFCETVIRHAAQQTVSPSDQLVILEGSIQGSCQVVVDITSRFLFESSVFEGRQARDLSASELCEAMTKAQKATYGDGLDSERLHPYMWAAKPHYYSRRSYYNYPYMFGLLFGLGLYAVYEQDPDAFKPRYDELLSRCGMASAPDLAAEFGMNVRGKEFWAGSLRIIEQDIDKFVTLVG